ncbi:MAG TPA: DUF460 domain-containing protein [Methanocorpusculum sp.]|nr:DUF460 domain-containing protein [Methanocorpusculum sp.]
MSPLVFGIDKIKPDSPGSPGGLYGIVRVVDNRIESEERYITLRRLLRLINIEKPDIVAAGTLKDIAPDTGSLFSLAAALPFETDLVQIIGTEPNPSPLPKIAERYNLRFDPGNLMEKAKTAALIAAFGGGYEVVSFTGPTTITVSPARARIRTHQSRYVRRIHGSFMSLSREVEADLLSNGMMFDSSLKRSSRGARKVLFTIPAPRHEVPVSSRRSAGVLIRVTGTRKDRPAFVPLSKKPAYLIVGIAPGTTVGIAALNLDGDLVHLSSSRSFGPPEIISALSAIGRPVMIASDKAEMPFGVEKVRRAFLAVAHTPAKDMLLREKAELAEGYDFNNDHERTALSAAVSAYQSYANKFESIQKRIPPGIDVETVRTGVIRGLSLEQVLEGIQDLEGLLAEPKYVPEEIILDEKDERILRLEEDVSKLRKLAGSLSEEVDVKDRAIAALQKRLVFERGERVVEIRPSEEKPSRDAELLSTKKALEKEERKSKALMDRLERMKHFISLQAGDGSTALKVLPELTKDQVKDLDSEMGIMEEDVLYVLKVDGWKRSLIREFAEIKIGAVILPRLTYESAHTEHLIEEFRNVNIPVLDGANLSPRVKGKIGVVDSAALETALASWNTTQLVYENEKKFGETKAAKETDPEPEFSVERQKPAPPQKTQPMFRPKPVPVVEVPEPIEAQVKKPVAKPAPEPAPKPVVKPAPEPAPKPVAKPAPQPAPKPVQKPAPEPVPKPVPVVKPTPKKEKPAKKPASQQKPEPGSAARVLFGVLSEYREERKKELKK